MAAASRPWTPVMLAVALVAAAGGVVGVGCDGAAPEQAAAAPGRTVEPGTPWSRADFGARPADVKSGGPASSAAPDRDALSDLVRAAPSGAPGLTEPGGGTRVGSETGVPPAGYTFKVEPPPQRAKKVNVQLGDVDVQADMASPAIEREARAQLYFPLVTRCRDRAGKILPPDAVLLEFSIDADGYIEQRNISATAIDPVHRSAAECMRRELSGLVFRGPAGARGNSTQVKMTVPSVD